MDRSKPCTGNIALDARLLKYAPDRRTQIYWANTPGFASRTVLLSDKIMDDVISTRTSGELGYETLNIDSFLTRNL